MFCENSILNNFAKLTGKHRSGFLFNKIAGLRPATLLKWRPWHKCFPGNFAKVLKNLFYRTPLVAASEIKIKCIKLRYIFYLNNVSKL